MKTSLRSLFVGLVCAAALAGCIVPNNFALSDATPETGDSGTGEGGRDVADVTPPQDVPDAETVVLPDGADGQDIVGMDGRDAMDGMDITTDMPVVDGMDTMDTPNGCPGGCPTGLICCGSSCVDLSIDTMNCGRCGMLCPGTACTSGSCTMQCQLGFLDCDMNVVNGCEVNAATDSSNCGGCGRVCATGKTCVGGACTCISGTADCDGNPSNGCEVNLATDLNHCGSCSTICGTNQTCTASACTCTNNMLDCNNSAADGCETDPTTSSANCGSCGHACGMNETCMAGSCVCQTGFLRCPSTATDCSVSVTDANNCGACGVVCSGATPVCSATGCTTACAAGETLCGTSCANLLTDNQNCGRCGTACGANSQCTGTTTGACTCNTGFGDCNNNQSDGCEAVLSTDNANCGGCGQACTGGMICTGGACSCPTGTLNCNGTCQRCCGNADCNDGNSCTADVCMNGTCMNTSCPTSTAPHCCGGTTCSQCCSSADCAGVPGNYGCATNGTCTTCLPGFGDCDGNPANGCESPLNTTANCGACGVACAFANATAACAADGTCAMQGCLTGFADCNNSPVDGCEINTLTNVNDCNACGNVCQFTGSSAACTNGMCMPSMCNPGQGDCDMISSNGCETDLTSSVNNCGACGNVCAFMNANAACVNSQCTLSSCLLNWGDCDSNSTNGCETNLLSSTQHCSSCSNACNLPNASSACSNGTCTIAGCLAGTLDCDGLPANGCEVNGNTPSNCGACSNVCPVPPNSSATCPSGQCGFSCTMPYGDCDGLQANGCETNTSIDPANCGACGHACANAMDCVNGACTPITGPSFSISSLNSTGCLVKNETSHTGSYAASIATSTNALYVAGSTYTEAFDAPTLQTATNAGAPAFLISDLQTGVAYAFGAGGSVFTNAGTATQLIPFDPTTNQPTGTPIALSRPITFPFGLATGLFSGYGRAVVVVGGQAFHIWFSSGVVIPMGTLNPPNPTFCYGGTTYSGVVEWNNGLPLYDYYASFSLSRYNPATNSGSGLPSYAPNACGFGFSTQRSRYYFQIASSYNQVVEGFCTAAWNPGAGFPCPTGTATCSTGCDYTNTSDTACAACGVTCPAGTYCAPGGCNGICPSGQMYCSATSMCTNTQTDTGNCGSCGHVCATGATCVAGTCTCPTGQSPCGTAPGVCTNTQTDNGNCGTCGTVCTTSAPSDYVCRNGACGCPGGWQACGSPAYCKDLLNDPQNCGTCGHTCGGAAICVAGGCQCPSVPIGQFLNCSSGCANTAVDLSNCGSCGHACTAGQACVNGACTTCTAPQSSCGSLCTNLSTDSNHCGSCTLACAPGQTCSSSTCSCAAPRVMCTNNNTCADLTSDPNNCGTCGNICRGGSCVNSVCTCPAGRVFCDGYCMDPNSSDTSCGSCNSQCAGNLNCSGGTCLCQTGFGTCSGACTDTGADESNCGGCGTACTPSQVCSQSTCGSGYTSYTVTTNTFPFQDACSMPGHGNYLSGVDDGSDFTVLPFPFKLYDTSSSTIYITSNGVIDVGVGSGTTWFANVCIPSSANNVPRPAIFAYWQDLVMRPSGACIAVQGTAPNRTAVITWEDAQEFAYLSQGNTNLYFTAILHEGTNVIDLLYSPSSSGPDTRGNRATIGVQNAAGTLATTVGCEQTLTSSGYTLTPM